MAKGYKSYEDIFHHEDPIVEEPVVEPAKKYGKVVDCVKLNVRKTPEVAPDNVVTTLPVDTEVEICAEANGYCYIRYDDVEGYCDKRYISY